MPQIMPDEIAKYLYLLMERFLQYNKRPKAFEPFVN
jgi:hypothetical protein